MQPDSRNVPPTAQKSDGLKSNADAHVNPKMGEIETSDDGGGVDWLARARSADTGSTKYLDSNLRKGWEDSIRAFNNEPPSDSKYNSTAFDKRSKLYRPKIRSVIRKNEAAAAAAFFSNMDTVNVAAGDQTDKGQLASADVMKYLLSYRLSKSIPWFQTVLGGIQDAQTTGLVCGHIHWEYEAIPAPEGAPEGTPPKVLKDKPVVDLVPIENMRFDAGASWIDIVNTSPYLIQMIPMYVMDIEDRMDAGEWKKFPVKSANTGTTDSTRVARNAGRQDAQSAESGTSVDAYDVVWVQRHIHRHRGEDWTFYTLGERALLTDPVPLKDVVFHGKRPYVIGCCILEAHKTVPSGVPMLAQGLSEEINEVANQRIDNVKFALNKRWFVKRGAEVDLGGLVRNVPGGVSMMNDPINDVREVTWPDVTQSSYAEQQGLDMSMDELLGNFNPASLMMNGAGNAPARNMAMLSSSNGTLVEYLIRTYVETFVQPVLRQLMLLEQEYETDKTILGLCSKLNNLYQRFGIDEVTDELLRQEVTLTVSVGMGATDPNQKLNKFLGALGNFTAMMKNPAPGLNMVEVGKEIFGHLGYQDGSRFFTNDNPTVLALQQQLRQGGAQIQDLTKKVQDKQTQHMVGLQKTRETNQTKIQTQVIKETNENKRSMAAHWVALHHNPEGKNGS
ncbi:MAG: hypothetical protein NVSMB70_01110 [Chamaesiphon sp.]